MKNCYKMKGMDTKTTLHDQLEAKFRKDRQHVSFKAQMFTALSTATFFGVLGTMVTSAVKAFGVGAGAAEAAALMTSPLPLAVMGVAVAAGIAFTYIAQKQWTDLRVLEDDHLARRNAECLEKEAHMQGKSAIVEFDQNQRADGKEWAQVVAAKAPSQEAARVI